MKEETTAARQVLKKKNFNSICTSRSMFPEIVIFMPFIISPAESMMNLLGTGLWILHKLGTKLGNVFEVDNFGAYPPLQHQTKQVCYHLLIDGKPFNVL
jgi:hypothetical protein